jgi:hypothetical protein
MQGHHGPEQITTWQLSKMYMLEPYNTTKYS